MLVYANSLKLEGTQAFSVASRSIHGWLKEKLGRDLSYGDLLKPGEWVVNEGGTQSAWLRSYISADESPELYAWRLKHPDSSVRGRQWLVELGLRVESDSVEVSCTVQTDETSVLVTDPVSASRPRVFQYLLDNLDGNADVRLASDVPGRTLKTAGRSIDEYRALLGEIEAPERDYPIVLVSPNKEGEYLRQL